MLQVLLLLQARYPGRRQWGRGRWPARCSAWGNVSSRHNDSVNYPELALTAENKQLIICLHLDAKPVSSKSTQEEQSMKYLSAEKAQREADPRWLTTAPKLQCTSGLASADGKKECLKAQERCLAQSHREGSGLARKHKVLSPPHTQTVYKCLKIYTYM